MNGTLYGTTDEGGTSGSGTVFSLDPKTGAETVLYSFIGGNSGDGAHPEASLIDVNGTLYGTTAKGGTYVEDAQGYGTVFAIDPKTGKETLLHSFCALQNCTDGANPSSPIYLKGKLYGTTGNGGVIDAGGTVFAIDLKVGGLTVVYSFCSQANCTDGQEQYAGLINVNGTLYGTTSKGGSANKGTVFALDWKTGAESVLYSFCGQENCIDGAMPYASVIAVDDTLYGTTAEGGAGDDGGTLFAVNMKTGKEKSVYSFCIQQTCSDGQNPYANLIDVKGTLYGTTQQGGGSGLGTVFALAKP